MGKFKLEVEIPDGKYCTTDNPITFVPCIFYWQNEDGIEGCQYLNEEWEQESGNLSCKKSDECPNPYKEEK